MNTEYQKHYLKNTHKAALWSMGLMIPACIGVARFYNTGWLLVAIIGCAIFAGPVLSFFLNPSGKITSFAIAFASQCFSALLIHAGHGVIEFHFMVFVSLALLIVLGDWRVVVVAAATIAAHHIAFFFFLRESVFNYEAVFGTVILHAVFVVLETIPAAMIAARFGRFICAQGVMAESLNTISERVLTHSKSLSKGSMTLAESAGAQAVSLEETSAALEEVSSMTRRNADNAKNAKQFTTLTHKTAETGAVSTREMGCFMEGIRRTSNEMREAMQRIQAASSNVSKIIKTIDEIAFQTNILALNAAVEAARAGEAGMGFAVVADEVRNLAQRSARAARETSQMIETSIQTSQAGLSVAEKVNQSIEEVATKSNQLEKLLLQILEHTKAVDEQVAQIAVASDEQARGISQVTNSLTLIDKNTQASSSTVQHNASSAHELTNQADMLNKVVQNLNGIVEGRASEHMAAQPERETQDSTIEQGGVWVSPNSRTNTLQHDSFPMNQG